MAIIPSQSGYLSVNGVDQVEKVINILNRKTGHYMNYKILMTMFDAHDTSSKVICKKLKRKYKEKVFNTIIELDSRVEESQIVNLPVFFYDKKSKSVHQYLSLAKEISAKT